MIGAVDSEAHRDIKEQRPAMVSFILWTTASKTHLQPTRSSSIKVRDIAGLYLNSPDHAVALRVVKKMQIQALDRTQPMLPMGLCYVCVRPTTQQKIACSLNDQVHRGHKWTKVYSGTLLRPHLYAASQQLLVADDL